MRASSFSGPIPPPAVLADYDHVVPGSADRILAMAESNARHRREIEAKVVDSNCRAQSRGQVLAFVLALTTIVAGSLLIYAGHEGKGFAMVVTAAGSLIGAYLWGRARQERERREQLTALARP